MKLNKMEHRWLHVISKKEYHIGKLIHDEVSAFPQAAHITQFQKIIDAINGLAKKGLVARNDLVRINNIADTVITAKGVTEL